MQEQIQKAVHMKAIVYYDHGWPDVWMFSGVKSIAGTMKS
jgi:hypothetical protein